MSERTIYDLLAEAQAEMRNPRKTKQGQVGPRRYMYATLDDVLDCVKPALMSRGIFLTQSTRRIDGDVYAIVTSARKGDEVAELDVEPYRFDANPQELGKRETYAKRYGLCKAFAITGDDDTDGDVRAARQGAKAPERQAPNREANPDLAPVRERMRAYQKARGGIHVDEAIREICQAAGIPDLSKATEEQAQAAAEVMDQTISMAGGLADEDIDF